MNAISLTRQGLGLIENLSFLAGPEATAFTGGVLVIATLIEAFLPEDGPDATVEAIEASTKTIISTLSQNFAHQLREHDLQDCQTDIDGINEWLRMVNDTRFPPGLEKSSYLPVPMETLEKWLNEDNSRITGPDTALRKVLSLTTHLLDDDNDTLMLHLVTALVFANACKYLADVDYQMACQAFLDATKRGEKTVPPTRVSGAHSRELLTAAVNALSDALTLAVPRIQQINTDKHDRRLEAEQAASIAVCQDAMPLVSGGKGAVLPQFSGTLNPNNAALALLLRQGQERAKAWERYSTDHHLTRLSLDDIQALNDLIDGTWKVYNLHAQELGREPSPPLTGIEPTPPPAPPPPPPPPPGPPPPSHTEDPDFPPDLLERGITPYW